MVYIQQKLMSCLLIYVVIPLYAGNFLTQEPMKNLLIVLLGWFLGAVGTIILFIYLLESGVFNLFI